MVALKIASELRRAIPAFNANASVKLYRALLRQPRFRAQFSSTTRQWSYQSLRSATPEDSVPETAGCSLPIAIDAIKDTNAAPPPTPEDILPDTPPTLPSSQNPNSAPLLTRTRTIRDTISITSLKALSDALSTYLASAGPSAHLKHGTFLTHFGGGAQSPSGYLEDGTDTFHWPGGPWNSRVWAGGSIHWNPDVHAMAFMLPVLVPKFVLSKLLECKEKIENVEYKGVTGSGKEKVLVRTRRTYGIVPPTTSSQYPDTDAEEVDIDVENSSAITEYRDLVFMPTKTIAEASASLTRPDRVIRPTITPDTTVKLTPRSPLLAEFSCLTHNAHRIHLDRGYAASEGFRNLVVHGPLSLYLMLTYLESVIPSHAKIVCFDYRNLAPLFCDEEMTICVRNASETAATEAEAEEQSKQGEQEQTWDIWITGSSGGYAVKGSAQVRLNQMSDKELTRPFIEFVNQKVKPLFSNWRRARV